MDTNILLLDSYNLINIAKSMSPSPIVVLPETVLDELDSKKSGFTEIAYQARQFGRLLSKANKTTSPPWVAAAATPQRWRWPQR